MPPSFGVPDTLCPPSTGPLPLPGWGWGKRPSLVIPHPGGDFLGITEAALFDVDRTCQGSLRLEGSVVARPGSREEGGER